MAADENAPTGRYFHLWPATPALGGEEECSGNDASVRQDATLQQHRVCTRTCTDEDANRYQREMKRADVNRTGSDEEGARTAEMTAIDSRTVEYPRRRGQY